MDASGHGLVDVGGYRLAITVEGAGTPPVVFVSGSGGDGAEWEAVRAVLGVPTTVVTYGRPGLGGSDPLPAALAEAPQPPSWIAAQLRTLLERAGVPAPRVLVGFSIGGPVVEEYAALWPEETAGLVAVDASDPRSFLHPDEPVTVDGGDTPGGIQLDWQACHDEQREQRPLASVPAVVITSAVGRWLQVQEPETYRPYTLAQLDELWQTYQRELAARTNGVQVIAHMAGHRVHEDAPALVARVVDAVVMAARNGGGICLDPVALHDAGGRLIGHSLP